ncbi:autophagy-related protein 16-1 isoform X2 [Nilaparvata lugens]|uniref:autophagy-related protein 16-1 isoform X2 n=1 Tax=Nilaparvata lugens TaxID=108931 RepID=UPI000B988554|nr:autophagy-related protein 16-1 isoform X2 [Nilaparvata lugens]
MAVEGELFSQSDWRKSIISQIQKRNKDENHKFHDLILFHNRLFDNWTALRHENLQLTIQNEKLRVEGSGSGGSANETKISILEQKLLNQQEELTELHKRRGEKAQLINDLKDSLKEKEKQISELEERLAGSSSECNRFRAEIEMYNVNRKNLEDLNLHVKDELHALQLEFVHLEAKLRKTQDENARLLEKLMKYKTKDAEKMNEENENFLRHRNAKMQKEIEDAVKEPRGLSPEQVFNMPISSAIPKKPILKFDAHDGEVDAVKWSPVDRLVATGGGDRKVKLWDVSNGILEPRGILLGSNRGVMSVDFDSTGTVILGASSDQATRVWTVADQRLRHTLTGHSDKVMAAKFIGEATKVVTGSYDRTLKIWDLRGRACQHTKFAGSSCNDLVTSDGSGSTIISGHFDKKIRFWDTRTESLENVVQLNGKITSLDISKDGRFLLACVRDDTLRIIDLRKSNTLLHTLSEDGLKISCDWARAVFSSDAKQVAVGSSDGSVFVLETTTNKVEVVLKDEHKAAVTAVAWHPYANFIASVGRNRQAVVWADL